MVWNWPKNANLHMFITSALLYIHPKPAKQPAKIPINADADGWTGIINFKYNSSWPETEIIFKGRNID